MNWDRIEGNWKQFKGNVKEQSGELPDDHLDSIAGKRDQLIGKIQENECRQRVIALVFGAATLLLAGWANADPPARVARLGFISGAVSFSPAGENDWVEARINRPLITGDRLWVDAGARAELQVGSAVFHMGGNTSVTLLNFNNRVAQLQLAQGTLNVRVRRLGPRDVVEIDTPNLAYSIRKPGGYRISVDPDDNATTVTARNGQAEVYGEGAAYLVNAGQTYRYYGTDLRDYDYLQTPRADAFDGWSSERDRRGDNSPSARYVSRDVIGYEDLDEHGSWRNAEGYGNVWVPNRVRAGWTPYQDGHWSWVEPWGWTWIDDAPWGFAVSHYGRWANLGGTWGWVPGPVRAQPVYAPALVAFIGGAIAGLASSSGNAANVGWFPLGPRDVYRPSYPVSRTYFNNVNTSNTTVNNTAITNVYNNTSVTNVTYVNQRVPGAVIAMPATAFAQSHEVAKARVTVSKEAVATAPVTPVAAVVPVQTSVHGGAPRGRRPPAEAQARPVVAKESPPPAPVPFAAKQSALAANPGKPLDAAALAAVKPTAPAPAPAVTVVTPPTQPAAAPPPKPPVAAAGGTQRSEAKKETLPPAAEKGRPSEAQKGTQSPDAEPGRPSDAQKGRRASDAQKEPSTDAQKAPQPPVSAPQPAVNVPPSPDTKKAPQPPEAQKAPQPPVSAPQPSVVVPQPPETKKGRQPSDERKAPPPAVSVPQPSEAQKPMPPSVNVPRPPEAQKAPPPAVSVPRPPEIPKGLPPEAQKTPQPTVSVPRPPETPKGSPPEAQKGQPADARKGPQSPDAQKGLSPDANKGPPLTEEQKAAAKLEAAKQRAERRRDKKGEDEESPRK